MLVVSFHPCASMAISLTEADTKLLRRSDGKPITGRGLLFHLNFFLEFTVFPLLFKQLPSANAYLSLPVF